MVRPEKVAAVDHLAQRLSETQATLLTEYRGLSVTELAELRRRLSEEHAEYKVVKNTLTRRAADQAGVDVPDGALTGPTAVAFCDGDPIAATKALRSFSRAHPALVIKGGVLDGKVLGSGEAAGLAELATREELLTKLAGMMGQLVAQPARLAHANLSKAGRLVSALAEKMPADGTAEDLAAGDGASADGDNEASAPQTDEA
jgi:large subunit ribosomal protein L10